MIISEQQLQALLISLKEADMRERTALLGKADVIERRWGIGHHKGKEPEILSIIRQAGLGALIPSTYEHP